MAKVAKKIATRPSKKASAEVASAPAPANEPVGDPVVVRGVEAPAVPASEPVQPEAVAPLPASVPVSTPTKRAHKGERADDQVNDPRAKWKRRLGRWQAKAVAAGVDAKALMTEALAG